MHIEIDYTFDPVTGHAVETHFIDTTPGAFPNISHPTLGATPVSPITFIAALHAGTFPIAGTGWDVISKHPSYPGKTRLQVFLAEIVRLNDTAARTALGV